MNLTKEQQLEMKVAKAIARAGLEACAPSLTGKELDEAVNILAFKCLPDARAAIKTIAEEE